MDEVEWSGVDGYPLDCYDSGAPTVPKISIVIPEEQMMGLPKRDLTDGVCGIMR